MLTSCVAFIATFANPCPAQEVPVLTFTERYDAAFAEAQARRVPVVILGFDHWREASGKLVQSLYTHPPLLEAFQNAVLLLISEEDHGNQKQLVGGKESNVCAEYGGVSCTAHMRLLPDVFVDFGQDGALVLPMFVVADPDRKAVATFTHEFVPEDVLNGLVKARKQLGPGLSRTEYLTLKDGLATVEQAVKGAEYRQATLRLAVLLEHSGTTSLHLAVREQQRDLEELASKRWDKVDAAWSAGEARAALFSADEVVWSFPGTPPARSAEKWLKKQSRSDAGRPFAKELTQHQKARALYAQGVEYDEDGDRRRALRPLRRVVAAYPDSVWAQKAQVLIEIIEDEDR